MTLRPLLLLAAGAALLAGCGQRESTEPTTTTADSASAYGVAPEGEVRTATDTGPAGTTDTTSYPDGSQTTSTLNPDGTASTTVSGPLAGQAAAVETGQAETAPTTSTGGAPTP
jgi:hypothetical protein